MGGHFFHTSATALQWVNILSLLALSNTASNISEKQADLKTMYLMFKNDYLWQKWQTIDTLNLQLTANKFWKFTVGKQASLKGQERMRYLSRVLKNLPLLATGSKVITPASLTTVLALSDSRLECKKKYFCIYFFSVLNLVCIALFSIGIPSEITIF